MLGPRLIDEDLSEEFPSGELSSLPGIVKRVVEAEGLISLA